MALPKNHNNEESAWIVPALQDSRETPGLESRGVVVEDYTLLIRNLVKSSGIYALSSLALPLVSLVLAPFLTRKLSSTEYGVLAVLTTVIALLAGITQFGLGSAFFRAYNYDYESRRDRLRVLSTVVALLSIISIPTAVAIILTAPWLAELLFKSSSLSGPMRLAAVVILLQNLAIPGLSWLRAENRVVLFTVLSIVNLLVNLGATLMLVGVLHMGISGALIATGGGYGVFVVCTLPVILLRAGLHLRFDIARNVLSFGLPNVASLVAIWVLQLSDRYLLAHLSSLAQTASYSVATTWAGHWVLLSSHHSNWSGRQLCMPSPKKLMQVRSFSCCFVGIASYYSLLPMHFRSSPHLRSMYFSHPHIMRHLSSSQLLLSPSCSMAFLSLSYLELVYCEKPGW
jgi:hypothetical protein